VRLKFINQSINQSDRGGTPDFFTAQSFDLAAFTTVELTWQDFF